MVIIFSDFSRGWNRLTGAVLLELFVDVDGVGDADGVDHLDEQLDAGRLAVRLVQRREGVDERLGHAVPEQLLIESQPNR